MITIKDMGAAGDGVADDTAVFQEALNDRRSIHIPAGTYRITSTLATPTDHPPCGIKWTGDGRSISDVLTVARHGAATVLMWDGPAGGTLLDLSSANGMVFEGLTFCGKTAAATTRAGCLIHLGLVPGWGSGGHSFREVDFQHADVGVQVMTLATDVNGDTCSFAHVNFNDCDTGFLTKNDQALGFRFSDLYATNCRTVLNMERGGMLSIDTANFTACGGPNPATDYCIRVQSAGPNSHCSVFSNVRVETGTKGVAQLIGYGKFDFVGFSEAQTDQDSRQFDFQGPLVSFRSSRFVSQSPTARPFKVTRPSAGFRSGLTFDACNFSALPSFSLPDWIEVDANSPALISVRSCTAGLADVAVPDMASQPQWGRVAHIGQSVDATPKNLYLDGAPAAGNSNSIVIPTDTMWMFDVTVLGKEHGGNRYASFKRRVTVTNIGGALTLGSIQPVGLDDNANGWACSVSTVATFVRAGVTGAAGVTIDWRASFDGQQVG